MLGVTCYFKGRIACVQFSHLCQMQGRIAYFQPLAINKSEIKK